MKKKRNILKKVLLICCLVGLLFTLTCYENYSEVAACAAIHTNYCMITSTYNFRCTIYPYPF